MNSRDKHLENGWSNVKTGANGKTYLRKDRSNGAVDVAVFTASGRDDGFKRFSDVGSAERFLDGV